MVKRTVILILALLLAAPLNLLAAQVSAVADRDRIGEEESLRLELRVQGSPDGDPDLSVLQGDWEILSRSQSSQMQIVNGDFSRSVTYTLTLMPRRTGELEIPAVCFGSDCSTPLPVRVSAYAAATRTDAPVLLETEAKPRQAVVGSQVLLTVRVLHRVDLAQASLSDPQLSGAEAEIKQIGKDRSFETRRGGTLYQAVERRYALFPREAGTLHIAGIQLDAQAAVASHLDFFGGTLRPLRRRSDPIDIEVEPVPGNLGARTCLPARALTLNDDWQQHPPSLRVGEPATRTLTLRASGLPSAHLPELKLAVPDGWKSYPDQPSRKDDADGEGIVGTLRQKIALVPTEAGTALLPAVDLDWYDLSAGKWRRAHLDPIRVKVAPPPPGAAASSSRASAPAPAEQTLPTTDAAPMTPTPPKKTAKNASEETADFWPWLSLALGLGWLSTLLLLWLRRRSPQPESCREKLETGGPIREKEALKAVLAACRSNDARGARQALLDWSRSRWPEGGRHDLERLAEVCGEPLASEFAVLGRSLFARQENGWQGARLAEGLESWKGEQVSRKPEELPPLYPR